MRRHAAWRPDDHPERRDLPHATDPDPNADPNVQPRFDNGSLVVDEDSGTREVPTTSRRCPGPQCMHRRHFTLLRDLPVRDVRHADRYQTGHVDRNRVYAQRRQPDGVSHADDDIEHGLQRTVPLVAGAALQRTPGPRERPLFLSEDPGVRLALLPFGNGPIGPTRPYPDSLAEHVIDPGVQSCHHAARTRYGTHEQHQDDRRQRTDRPRQGVRRTPRRCRILGSGLRYCLSGTARSDRHRPYPDSLAEHVIDPGVPSCHHAA